MGKFWNDFSAGFSSQFGDSFLYTLENERKRQQQQEQFNKDMAFQNRQLDLLQDYREQSLGIGKQEQQRLGYQSFIENFAPTKTLGTGRENPRTGNFDYGESGRDNIPITKESEIEKNLGIDIPSGSYVNKALIPIAPKPEGIERTETLDDNGNPIVYGITDSGKKIELGIDYGEKTKRINANKPRENKDKPTLLNEKFERDAFGRLVDPLSVQKPPEGVDPMLWALMGGSKQYPVENDFTTVATGVLQDSDILKKLQTVIQTEGGYPSGRRLVEMLEPQLTDEQLKKLNTFLDYYDQFEMNLPKNETPMKTY